MFSSRRAQAALPLEGQVVTCTVVHGPVVRRLMFEMPKPGVAPLGVARPASGSRSTGSSGRGKEVPLPSTGRRLEKEQTQSLSNSFVVNLSVVAFSRIVRTSCSVNPPGATASIDTLRISFTPGTPARFAMTSAAIFAKSPA